MITVQEIYPPIKVSGLTSFLVIFPYDQKIIQAIKTIPIHVYHKKIQAWQIPTNYLAACLDTLTHLSDIKLSLLEDNTATEENLTQAEIAEFRFKPFEHQIEAMNFGLREKRWLLCDQMGTGKTLVSIGLAQALYRRNKIKHCLIICGVDGLRQNFKREIEKFSNYGCRVLGQKITKNNTIRYTSIKDRVEELKKPIDAFFVVVNITTIRDPQIVEAINKGPNEFGFIVYDECHKGTRQSTQGQNLLKLQAPYKIGMSGTLIVRNPLSTFIPLSWIGVQHATYTNFQNTYCVKGGFSNKQVVGYQNLDFLRQVLKDCTLRRTLDQVAPFLPPKNVSLQLIEMSDEHRKFYEAIKDGVKEQADKIELNTNNLLALTTRLRQASQCPQLLTTSAIQSAKIARAVQIAEDLVQQNQKVVIFTAYKQTAYLLYEKLKHLKASVNTGDQSDAQVAKNKDIFQDTGNMNIFIGTIAKCSTGYTLNAASYLLMLSEDWSYSNNSQAHDRIHRINNTKPAFIKVLACADTIDDRVHQISQTKKALSEYLMDGKQNQYYDQIQNDLRNLILSL